MDIKPDQVVDQRPIDAHLPGLVEERHHLTGRDSQLQAVRRIDWRFLLPNPNLRQVAYFGPNGGTLLKALKAFSDSLYVISLPDLRVFEKNSQPRFNLVVLSSSQLSDLEGAQSLLNAGGYLYWEIDRTRTLRSWRNRIKREGWAFFRGNPIGKEGLMVLHYRHYVKSLERLGFEGIQVNWHRPNFEACLEMIPLDDPLVLNYVFARGSGKLSDKIKLGIGRFLMKVDLLGCLVPCLSIMARRPATESEVR